MKVRRKHFDTLIEQINKPYISIIIGPRQVGKSFLLEELKKKCIKLGKSTAYYNLEFPDDLLSFSGSESEIINMLKNGPDVIFIDEFHYLKNATKILKAIHDMKAGKKIYASGSSSIEIHKHLKESLVGRFRVTHLGPLTLSEQMTRKAYKKDDYLVMGGMPGLIHEDRPDDKMRLLKNIVETYLLKDIKALIKEENIRAFNNLLYHLAQNQGSISTVAGFAREVRLSEPAVNHHLDIMEQTRVAFGLTSYSANLSNELKKSKKYYIYDLGIRNSILNDFSPVNKRPDSGILLESYVFLSLQELLKPNMELKFWRTRQGNEVDFIILKNRIPHPIEVKLSLDRCDIPPGIKKFLSAYPKAPVAYVISKDLNGSVQFDSRKVFFVSWDRIQNITIFTDDN